MVVEKGDALSLSKGYKQTEVGVVPEDWDVLTLKNVLNGLADVDHYMPKTIDQGIPYLMTGDLKELVSDINFDNCKQISLSDYKLLSKKIKNSKGDLILARYATIGTVSYVDINSDFVVSYSCVTIRPNPNKLVGKFLFHYFKSSAFAIEVSNVINTGTQANVGIGDLYAVKIALPSLPAQTAIANALSDMDALIAQTEKLIEKKKAIKQGVMQELLKPKEGWVTKKLGEVYIAMKGKILGKSDVSPNGKYDCILYGELFTTYKEEIFYIKSRTNQTGVASVCDDILFPGSTTTSGIDLAKCSVVLKDNVQLGGDIVILRKQTKEINSLFVAYYLNQFCKNEIAQSTRGITIHHLYGKDLVGIKIKYPELIEQVSIVNTILDIDHEVEILFKKLQKLKHKKQGMMQALLTGKIRLI